MAILNDNEFVETEGRAYVNPQIALDESNAFIENLRNTQQSNNQQIQTDTYNLGTAVPSNLGGLTSPTGDAGLSYFTSRYQTPQTNAVVENLRSVAQATALNQALQNEQEKWKKRYNDAYRAYQKSAYDKANSDPDTSNDDDGVDETSTSLEGRGTLTLDSEDIERGGKYIMDPSGNGNMIRVDDTLDVKDPNYQQIYVQQPDGSYTLEKKAITQPWGGSVLDVTGLLTNYWKPSNKNSRTSNGGFGGGGR